MVELKKVVEIGVIELASTDTGASTRYAIGADLNITSKDWADPLQWTSFSECFQPFLFAEGQRGAGLRGEDHEQV
jgi:hypothetical protein